MKRITQTFEILFYILIGLFKILKWLVLIPVNAIRTRNIEKKILDDTKAYDDYCQKIKQKINK